MTSVKINRGLYDKMVSCLEQADLTLFDLEGQINPCNEDLVDNTHQLMEEIANVLNEIGSKEIETI